MKMKALIFFIVIVVVLAAFGIYHTWPQGE